MDLQNKLMYQNLIFVNKILQWFLEQDVQSLQTPNSEGEGSQKTFQKSKESLFLQKLSKMIIKFEYSDDINKMNPYDIATNFINFINKIKGLTK